MRIDRSFSPHKLARLQAWTLLWLARIAGWAPDWALVREFIEEHLALLTRVVASLIILRATPHLRAPRRLHGRPFPILHQHGSCSSAVRAVLGARLRKALRGRDIAARIFALLSVLRDLDAHVRAMRRRMARGFARRRPIRAARSAEASAPHLRGVAAHAADTS